MSTMKEIPNHQPEDMDTYISRLNAAFVSRLPTTDRRDIFSLDQYHPFGRVMGKINTNRKCLTVSGVISIPDVLDLFDGELFDTVSYEGGDWHAVADRLLNSATEMYQLRVPMKANRIHYKTFQKGDDTLFAYSSYFTEGAQGYTYTSSFSNPEKGLFCQTSVMNRIYGIPSPRELEVRPRETLMFFPMNEYGIGIYIQATDTHTAQMTVYAGNPILLLPSYHHTIGTHSEAAVSDLLGLPPREGPSVEHELAW